MKTNKPEILEKIDIKAQAGLCQMTLGGKHEFLKDIRQMIADAFPDIPKEETGERRGNYFCFERGEYVWRKYEKPRDGLEGRNEFYPAGGLTYTGALNREQRDQLDGLITAFMNGLDDSKENAPVALLIEELWTDPTENHSAMGYKPIGISLSKFRAHGLIQAAGVVEGTGWPIEEGKTMPKLRATALKVIS